MANYTGYTDTEALSKALDAAAPDKGSWIDGWNIFHDTSRDFGTIEESFHAALNAAAPDQESWLNGESVLLVMGKLSNHTSGSRRPFGRTRAAARNVKALLTQPLAKERRGA